VNAPVQQDSGAPTSLAWGLRFTAGVAEPVTDEKPPGRGARDWTWTHFRLGDVRAQAALKAMTELPHAARTLFTLKEDRIAIDQDDGWTFGVLPEFERDLGGEAQREARLIFAVKGKRLLTGRLHPLRAVDDLRRRAERGAVIEGPAAALTAVIEIYADVAEDLLDKTGARLALVEDYVLTEPQDPRHSSLSGERRGLARHRRELQGLRSALIRAQGGRQGERVQLLADALPDLISLVEDVDHEAAGLQERARLLHEEIDTLINAATNRSMRALTIISTLLIPPTLIVGAFGMNLKGIVFGEDGQGFAIVCALCAATVVGVYLLLKRLRVLR
jgi:zinc transporter